MPCWNLDHIEGTAGWFYKKFPKFLNLACYAFLEEAYNDPNILLQYKDDAIRLRTEGNEPANKKRRVLIEEPSGYPEEKENDVVHLEPIDGEHQASDHLGGSGLWNAELTVLHPTETDQGSTRDLRSDGSGEDVLASTGPLSDQDVSLHLTSHLSEQFGDATDGNLQPHLLHLPPEHDL